MASVNPAMLSSDQRAMRIKMRGDLVISEGQYQGETCWIVKDPIGLKYYRLRKFEIRILNMLNGNTSLRLIKETLEGENPEREFRIQEIENLIGTFHKQGLIISEMTGQGPVLLKNRRKEIKKKVLGSFASVLSLKFPGIDPERFLSWLYPKVRFLFHPIAFLVFMALSVAALSLVLVNLHEFQSRLPDFQYFFGAQNLIQMGVVLIGTKLLHELGHGIFCKHYKGECHEIGFMLLVMMPAMYCNTSDSWILKNKWHRMAIGAAGIYVELILAAVATIVWWYTHPGWIHYAALNIMFLCSVSTILFNGNPLLRYDGYYILSDFLEIPNLSQKSRSALISKLRVWCLGMKPIPARQLPERNQLMFSLYAVASFCYRWFIMFSILWFICKVFEPWGLEVLGHIMIGISLIGLIVMPIWKLIKFFSYPGRFREVKRKNFVVTSVLSAGALWAFFAIPVPQWIHAPFVIEPNQAEPVVVQQPGMIQELLVEIGDQVRVNDKLAILVDPNLDVQIEALRGRIGELEATIEASKRVQLLGSGVDLDLASKQAELTAFQNELLELNEKASMLTLRAGQDGMVFGPPDFPARPTTRYELPTWHGNPFQNQNAKARLEADTTFCLIGQAKDVKASIYIEQSYVEKIQPDQQVNFRLDEYPSARLESSISEIANDAIESVPAGLSKTNKGPIAVKPSETGIEKPILTYYQVSADLSNSELEIHSGYHGWARIRVDNSSLGSRLVRYFRSIINFG